MHAFLKYEICHNVNIPQSILAEQISLCVRHATELYGRKPLGIALSPREYIIAKGRKDDLTGGLQLLTFPVIRPGQIFIRKRPINFDVYLVEQKFFNYDYMDSIRYRLGYPPKLYISRFYQWRKVARATNVYCASYPLLNEVWALRRKPYE